MRAKHKELIFKRNNAGHKTMRLAQQCFWSTFSGRNTFFVSGQFAKSHDKNYQYEFDVERSFTAFQRRIRTRTQCKKWKYFLFLSCLVRKSTPNSSALAYRREKGLSGRRTAVPGVWEFFCLHKFLTHPLCRVHIMKHDFFTPSSNNTEVWNFSVHFFRRVCASSCLW